MSNAIIEEVARNKSGPTLPSVEREQAELAMTIIVPFQRVRDLLAGLPAPKRPSRTRPIHNEEPMLLSDLQAWEAASDEAFDITENELPEA